MTNLEVQYINLTTAQKDYFEHLADGSNTSEPIDYFEKVPAEIRSNPADVEIYLNGGTVTKEVWMHDRGRLGGQYETVEYEMRDRDWSHDVSRHNGGSDNASNGRFEDASVNRARGADNTTPAEIAEAIEADATDVSILTDAQRVGNIAILGESVEATSTLATVGEVTLDFFAPVVGGVAAGKLVADQFDRPITKVAAGTATGVGTYLVLGTPIGQLGLGCYMAYKLIKYGHKVLTKKAA